MKHELIMPLSYINQWHHIFTAVCKCGWESKTLADSTRRLPYRDPVLVARKEFLLHCKCARVQRDIITSMNLTKHDMITGYTQPHDWRLEFDNSAENYYTVICSCGWRSLHCEMRIRENEKHYKKDIVKLRKFIRSHLFTNQLVDNLTIKDAPRHAHAK